MSFFESKFVKRFYEEYSQQFHDTRKGYVWKGVKLFIKSIPKYSLVADLGCGDGRNMYDDNLLFVGCDNCQNLIKICHDRNLNVVECDVTSLPFKDNSFDYAICIAVLHHLSNEERRVQAIKEALRILKFGGKILYSVWSYEQDPDSRRCFEKGDNIVTWELKNGTKINRYYYIYSKDDLISFFERHNISINDMFYEKGNWYFVIQK